MFIYTQENTGCEQFNFTISASLDSMMENISYISRTTELPHGTSYLMLPTFLFVVRL
jgi:hypothetical protein